MKLKNNVKGITLIALVVTIIVLLILAGIALNLTIGENGLFTRAQNAANTWQLAEQNEQNAMNSLAGWIDSVSGDKNTDETEPTYTKVFAQLYDNGDGTETLIFTSDENYREEGKEPKQSWNITDEHFENNVETIYLPQWLNTPEYMNSTITTVKIVNEIKPKYTSCMFAALTRLENIEGMENLKTVNTVDMSCMFLACASLESIDLSSFDTSKATNMESMFAFCSSLTSIDLSHFDTSNVTNMYLMFGECTNLKNLDLSSFDTSNVTNMVTMFAGCSNLTIIDLSSFNTSNVTEMSSMFNDCTNLSTIYVGPNWTTDNKDTSSMFTGCGTNHVTPKP